VDGLRGEYTVDRIRTSPANETPKRDAESPPRDSNETDCRLRLGGQYASMQEAGQRRLPFHSLPSTYDRTPARLPKLLSVGKPRRDFAVSRGEGHFFATLPRLSATPLRVGQVASGSRYRGSNPWGAAKSFHLLTELTVPAVSSKLCRELIAS